VAGNSRHDGKSVTRKVIAIMCAFTTADELSNVQIARIADIPVSTAHRLLGELVVGGMLERTRHRQYRVGPNVRAIVASRERTNGGGGQ
jgi:DNA-binding IclR family transcriptional regulator